MYISSIVVNMTFYRSKRNSTPNIVKMKILEAIWSRLTHVEPSREPMQLYRLHEEPLTVFRALAGIYGFHL